eukprot:5822854-Pyramimonas_sp.AAC.1
MLLAPAIRAEHAAARHGRAARLHGRPVDDARGVQEGGVRPVGPAAATIAGVHRPCRRRAAEHRRRERHRVQARGVPVHQPSE